MGIGEVDKAAMQVKMDEIAKGILKAIKETHPDSYHFYVLEKLLLSETPNHDLEKMNHVWRRVKKVLDEEDD